VFVWLNILLVLGAIHGWRWCVYVLAGVTLVGGVAQAATLEPRRFILSALLLGAATAFVGLPRRDAKAPKARADLVLLLPQHPDEHSAERPILLAVDQELGEGATLRVAPELSDPVGSLEVGQHEDVE